MDSRHDLRRGLEEAAGHVAARKSEHRKVNQEWHGFLRFAPSSLPLLKRQRDEKEDRVDSMPKRPCE
jgi:hypothetical protein